MNHPENLNQSEIEKQIIKKLLRFLNFNYYDSSEVISRYKEALLNIQYWVIQIKQNDNLVGGEINQIIDNLYPLKEAADFFASIEPEVKALLKITTRENNFSKN